MYVECEVDFMTESSLESIAEVVMGLNEKKSIRVLHVDDEASLLKIAKQCLENEGSFQVDVALSVDEAMEKMRRESYDVVVSDYQMPGKDGLEFLEELRQKGNVIPFIMFTGKGREEVAIKALNMGADQYLNKNGAPDAVYCELAHAIGEAVERRRTEEELRRFSTAVRESLDGIITGDLNGNITDVNDAALRMYGSSDKGDLIGKNVLDFLVETDRTRALQDSMESMKKGQGKTIEYKALKKNGTEIPIEITTAFIRGEQGEPTGFVDIVRNIAERKKAEDSLKESEKKYYSLYSSMSEGVALHEITYDGLGKAVDYIILDVNPAFESIIGIKKEKAVGSKASELYETGKPPYMEIYAEVAASGKPTSFETYFPPMRKHFSISVFSPARGKFATVFYDITERKKAEKETESMAKFPAQNPEPVFRISSDGTLLYANQASQNMLKESLSKKDRTVIETLRRRVADALSSNELSFFEEEHADRVFQFRIAPVTSECYANVYVADITERKQMEKQLKESEEKYRGLFENARDVIVLLDLKGNVTSINKAAEEYGFNKSEMLGKNMLKFIYKRYWPKLLTDIVQIALGKTAKDRIEIHTPKGDKIAEYRSNPIFSENRVVGIQTILEDTTEGKKTEEALRESEEKYKDLFENAMDVVLTLDLKGSITEANNSALRFGYKKEDLIGKNVLDFVSKEYWPAVTRDFSKVTQGEPAKNEIELAAPAGKIFVEYHARAIIKENNVAGVQINIRDITERKKSEELLRESEGRFRGLFENIQDPVGIFVGREGRLIDYNVAFKRSSGYTDEELKGKAFLDFVHADDRALVLEKYQTEYSEEEFPLVYEIRGMNKNGESLPLEISVSPYKKKGQAIGIEVIHRDITERKHYERSLSTLNTYSLRLNTAKAMEEIYELTLDAAEKTLGFEFADVFMVKGKMLQLVTHRGKTEISSPSLPMDGDRGISVRAARTGKLVLIPDISKEEAYVEGEEGARSELAVPIKIGPRVLGVLNVESKDLDAFNKKDQELLEILAAHAATAISNLDRAKELETYALEIRETKHKFEGLFLGNPEATVYLAPDFHILDINPRFEKLFRYSLSEIKGKHIDEVIVPKDKMKEAEMLDGKAVEGYVYHDTFRMRKDGSLVPVSISAAPIKVEGKLIGYIGVYKDVSDQKRTERELVLMNEKLRVVGGLTRHDARNKLSVITGNAYLTKKELAGNKKVLDHLEEMEKSVSQVVRIFDFARIYEMLGAEKLTYVDVEKTVNEAISLFSNMKGIKVINDSRGLTVLADSLLRQLFYNLVDNSLKYGEKLTQIRIYYERAEGNQLRLVYEDDGVGISYDEKTRLFREGCGKGTGYGLYLIRKMMEVYGWSIQETGIPGKGARFTVTIPRASQSGKENYRC